MCALVARGRLGVRRAGQPDVRDPPVERHACAGACSPRSSAPAAWSCSPARPRSGSARWRCPCTRSTRSVRRRDWVAGARPAAPRRHPRRGDPALQQRRGRHPRHPLLLHGRAAPARARVEPFPTAAASSGSTSTPPASSTSPAATLTVRGRGRVTWRAGGRERHWRAPEVVSLAEVTSAGGARPPVEPSRAAGRAGGAVTGDGQDPFMEEVNRQRDAAAAALAARDPDGVAASHPGDRDGGARLVERHAPVRRARPRPRGPARAGGAPRRAGPRRRDHADASTRHRSSTRCSRCAIGPASRRRFADADALRDALLATGVAVHDTPQGSTWELEAARPG